MSGTSSNRILSIYKARNTILEFMDKLNYDISEYNTFSINEIDAMFINNQQTPCGNMFYYIRFPGKDHYYTNQKNKRCDIQRQETNFERAYCSSVCMFYNILDHISNL